MSVATLAAASYGLPTGVTLSTTLAVLIPVAIVTIALRWLPFIFTRVLTRSHFVGSLGATMPIGVMVVLVIFAINGQASAPGGIPAALLALAVTVGLHVWRRNVALSIFAGTGFYMILVNLAF